MFIKFAFSEGQKNVLAFCVYGYRSLEKAYFEFFPSHSRELELKNAGFLHFSKLTPDNKFFRNLITDTPP